MATPQRVTLATIAKTAKLSVSAVSMAMRNDPSIPLKTRERVQKTAQKLGYRPNPMIAALNQARSAARPQHAKAQLAYLCYQSRFQELDENHTFRLLYEGVKDRATGLGYGIDLIYQKEYRENPKRLTQVLLSRGIQGVIISPRPKINLGPGFDWEKFAVVALGFRFSQIDRVVGNNYVTMQLILERLHARGYRRIGFSSGDLYNELNSRHMSGAYLVALQEMRDCTQIPILYYDQFTEKAASSWMIKHRPDCVIASDPSFIEWIQNAGYRVPEDLGLVSCCARYYESLARLDFCPRNIGANAVSTLSAKLIHNERGKSDDAKLILTPGNFVEGPSIRQQ